MTTSPPTDRVRALATRAKDLAPLVMLTAYDFVSAQIVDAAGVDLILVGDSAATTILGYETTREIEFDELIMLTRAVRRGVKCALVVGDLPYGSYEESDEKAVTSARAFAAAGCELIKLEGAGAMLSRVRAIVACGVPVVGHVGLLPQAYASFRDLRARGRSATDALQIMRDAESLADAGVSAIVIEAVPSVVASVIARRVSVPVIGIGAGSRVDGQVLVLNDVLGLGDGHSPRFVRKYANLRAVMRDAVLAYARDVRTRQYPAPTEEYAMVEADHLAFEQGLH